MRQAPAEDRSSHVNRHTSERFEVVFPINKAFAVALVMLAVVAWLSLLNARDMLDFDRTDLYADDVIHQLDQLLLTMQDAESDQRAFLLIGEERYLDPCQKTIARLDHELAGLKRLTEKNPQHQKRLLKIETAIDEKLAELKQTIDLRRNQSIEATANKVRENIGQGRMAHVQEQVNAFHADEDRLKQERLAMKAARNHGLIVTIVAGYALSFVLLTLVFILLRKQIGKRLQAEASLVVQQEQLEETVALRTRELELANTALRRENEERQAIDAALSHSNARLDLLAEIASQLLKSDAPQEVVEDLCCKVMVFLDCHLFVNFLLDKESGRLHLNASAGIPAAEAARIEWLDYGGAACGCVARDGQRIIVENIQCCPVKDLQETPSPRVFGGRVRVEGMPQGSDPHPSLPPEPGGRGLGGCSDVADPLLQNPNRTTLENIGEGPDPFTELVKGYGIQAYACHPLIMEGEVIGTLTFGTRNRPCFASVEIAMMQAVADQVAVAMFRQQTTEALRDNEERLRLVLSASQTGSFEVDLLSGYGQWNDVLFALLGMKPGDVKACPETFFRFVHPDDRDSFRARWEEALRTGELNCEFRIIRADGEERWLVGKGRFLYAAKADSGSQAPQAIRFLGVNYDITERKRAEEALRESESRLQTLANAMPQLAWIAQPDGYIFWYNQRWYDYTGTTPEQMEGWGWQNVHDPEVLPQVLAEWRVSLATAQPFEMEFPLRGADGRFRQFLTRGYPLKDAEGRVVRWFGTNTDVSERKQAEERIQASLHEKEVLLKEIHHRVKNNLQVISSLVDLQADSIDDAALSGLFQDVRDRVRSMAMVHETFYRSDNLVSVDFAEYASGLLHYLWRAHGNAAARVTLSLDLHPLSLAVETAVPCGLLLNELAVNALKHAFTGRDEGEVVVSLQSGPDGRVCLGVRDNGVGFAGVEDWRQKRSLGLNLVQMLTKQLKGTVEVESQGGTAFRITFTPPAANGKETRELPASV